MIILSAATAPYSSLRLAEKMEEALDSKIDHCRYYCSVMQEVESE